MKKENRIKFWSDREIRAAFDKRGANIRASSSS